MMPMPFEDWKQSFIHDIPKSSPGKRRISGGPFKRKKFNKSRRANFPILNDSRSSRNDTPRMPKTEPLPWGQKMPRMSKEKRTESPGSIGHFQNEESDVIDLWIPKYFDYYFWWSSLAIIWYFLRFKNIIIVHVARTM